MCLATCGQFVDEIDETFSRRMGHTARGIQGGAGGGGTCAPSDTTVLGWFSHGPSNKLKVGWLHELCCAVAFAPAVVGVKSGKGQKRHHG